MLHELAHIVHGPHNQQFHALWDQLRDECQGLIMKGYTGEGFLGHGQRLGGARMPDREARRLAREAAEKRRIRATISKGSGQKLGGSAPRPGQDIRQIIASAAERRNVVLKGCGSQRFNDREIVEIADTATRNGFRTQAEEDEANETAIAQALWELVQEDEKTKYGTSYVRPSANHPEGKGGGSLIPTIAAAGAGDEALASAAGPATTSREPTARDAGTNGTENAREPNFWVCETCTLHNPLAYLACEACGSERTQSKRARPADHSSEPAKKSSITASTTGAIDLTRDSPPKKRRHDGAVPGKKATSTSDPSPSTAAEAPWVWICSFCGTAMERQWWTCSLCGKMKESSK